VVCLNPWELARLAAVKGLTSRVFRDRFCEFGGIRLRFANNADWNGLTECSQYVPDFGCSVYAGRPLVCRLYPLGRLRGGKELHYVYMGNRFPCLASCPAVLDSPYLTVADYLAVQDVRAHEAAQDKYMELMQRLADNAFVLLLESGLAASGDRLTISLWRKLGNYDPEHLAQILGPEWIDRLMLPEISGGLADPAAFASRHHEKLQSQAQASFGNLDDFDALRKASGMMMGLALHLGCGLGVNTAELAEHWIVAAKKLGAQE
jgi:Fe-S-cluster containining protein